MIYRTDYRYDGVTKGDDVEDLEVEYTQPSMSRSSLRGTLEYWQGNHVIVGDPLTDTYVFAFGQPDTPDHAYWTVWRIT